MSHSACAVRSPSVTTGPENFTSTRYVAPVALTPNPAPSSASCARSMNAVVGAVCGR